MLSAQSTRVLSSLQDDEQSAIEAIALYPVEERAAILTAAQHPEILVRMNNIRHATEARFQELISELSEADQQRIYNLSRYPDLLELIGNRDRAMGQTELQEVLMKQPAAIHADAAYVNQHYFNLVREIRDLYDQANLAFEDILKSYPDNVREAYHQLAQLPGVVSILSDNMGLTVLLGDIARNQPDALEQELDSLSVVLAEQQAAELQEWKTRLEEDPEAMQEYEEAAKEFAGEQGYDDEPYSGPMPDRYREEVYVHHVWRPYPYWFGWPVWYEYECWYPYPWWYHWGFYYGPSNVIVIVGLPSNVFMHWHFRHHRHFYHYPHFTDHVIRHHYGPRTTGSSFQPVIRKWEREHQEELPADWLKDDKNRVERLRDYGKFRMDYEQVVRETTVKAPSTREYLMKHITRYPTLQPVLEKEQKQSRTIPEKVYTPDRQPPKQTYEPREKVIEQEKPNREEEVNRAKEKHENIWDLIKRQPADKERAPRTVPDKREPAKVPPRTEPTRKEPVKRQPAKTEPAKKEPVRKKD